MAEYDKDGQKKSRSIWAVAIGVGLTALVGWCGYEVVTDMKAPDAGMVEDAGEMLDASMDIIIDPDSGAYEVFPDAGSGEEESHEPPGEGAPDYGEEQ